MSDHKTTMDDIESLLEKSGVTEDHYPDWYKEGQYDAVLMYHKCDRNKAHDLKAELEKVSDARICTEDDSCLYYQGMKRQAECFKKSTFLLIYVTPNFINDFYCDLLKEEAFSEMISNPKKRWCLIPIASQTTLDNIELPFGFRGLKPMELKSDSEDLQNGEFFESFSKKNFAKMIKMKAHVKLDRKDKDDHQLSLWKIREFKIRMKDLHEKKAQQQAAVNSHLDLASKMMSRVDLNEQYSKTPEYSSTSAPDGPFDGTSPINGSSKPQNVIYKINNCKVVQIGDSNSVVIQQDDDEESEDDEDVCHIEENKVDDTDVTYRKVVE